MHCNGGVVCALVEHDHSVPRSGCDWRVEAIHELDEHFLEAGLLFAQPNAHCQAFN
jgi:hypothetical protein